MPDHPPKSITERIAWLFSKAGLPVLVSIIAGFFIGFLVNGALGLILATVAGFGILFLFNRLPIRLTPWQSLVVDIGPVLAKLSFLMIFLLPVASYLTLPSGHTPDTLAKYLSIVIALPDNLVSKPGTDVFPGFAIVVIISMALMLWGASNLGKTRHWLIALAGLLLYTFSPTIASILTGDVRLRIIMSFFSIGYYLAWVGLILIVVSKILPRVFQAKPLQVGTGFGLLSIVPPVIAFGLFNDLSAVDVSAPVLFGAFDFEETHHFVAGVFSGGVAGWGAGVITSGNEAPPETTEPEAGEPEEPEETAEPQGSVPPPQRPQPYSGPDVPEGSTIEINADGSKTIRCPDGYIATKYPDGTEVHKMPDGTTATKYSDGTVHGEHPDGSVTTEYPDGTTKYWGPDGTTKTEYPDGSFETSSPDGYKASLTKNNDGTMDVTSGDGEKLHFPKDGPPVGSMTGADGTKYTFNEDGTGTMTSPHGGTMTIDKDGNMSGSFIDKDGNKITAHPDGSMEAETADGDKISVNAEGLKATFKNGDFIQTDANGNPVNVHVSSPEGTLDIKTDEKGTHIKGKDKEGSFETDTDPQGNTTIKDDKGNTTNVNADGSGNMAGPDGKGAWDAKGNGEFTTPDGAKWKANENGNVSVTDSGGNKAEVGADGSLSVTKDGKTTTYTPDQVKQLQAEATGGLEQGRAGQVDNVGGNEQ
jgi:hypothetical protein